MQLSVEVGFGEGVYVYLMTHSDIFILRRGIQIASFY